ncbi:MAG: hypothetical protein IPP36_01160 [Nitrosomonadales bacterium]|nr:hypothetical protein [Nitrosomonadales bacterium]
MRRIDLFIHNMGGQNGHDTYLLTHCISSSGIAPMVSVYVAKRQIVHPLYLSIAKHG